MNPVSAQCPQCALCGREASREKVSFTAACCFVVTTQNLAI
jgi:hypothetical protein